VKKLREGKKDEGECEPKGILLKKDAPGDQVTIRTNAFDEEKRREGAGKGRDRGAKKKREIVGASVGVGTRTVVISGRCRECSKGSRGKKLDLDRSVFAGASPTSQRTHLSPLVEKHAGKRGRERGQNSSL